MQLSFTNIRKPVFMTPWWHDELGRAPVQRRVHGLSYIDTLRWKMTESISTIKNPLTVIAIFAGLAEVAGTVVLPFIAPDNQMSYIWFLMLFPAFLVSLFFATLNFNSKVLYAPSDFRDEKNYMEIFRPSSTLERFEKIQDEISDETSAPKVTKLASPSAASPAKPEIITTKSRLLDVMQRDPRSRYMLAESLIIDQLSSELGSSPKKEMALQNKFGSHLFDAVYEDPRGLILVEIKFLSEVTYLRRMRDTLSKIESSLSALPENIRRNSRFLLAIAYEVSAEKAQRVERELKSMLEDFRMPIELRMYSLEALISHAEEK